MADEEEWKKLSTDRKVQHKAWKARAEGYKECIKNFPTFDEKSPEFGKYLGLVKKFVTDSNELNRIQGLQASLIFVENASVAGKTCGEVLSGIVAKCFNSKPRLKELGSDVCLMYIEIDKNELVQEELIKGFGNKQPKIVNACLEVTTKALSLFGSKVMPVKPVIKETIKLLDHRDKNVRESAKALFVEIYRWIGPAIRVPLQTINAVVLKELEEEWEKVGTGGQASQTRFMRSQQDLREKMEAKVAEASGEGPATVEEPTTVDPYDILEPVEILSKLPKNFYEQIEEKKWQERKLALESAEKLCVENLKLVSGDYADLVKALKKVLSKDTNIMLVTIAIKCIGGLAKGLRKKFQPYAIVCLEGMFERFKEKKVTVINPLQEATDAIYSTTNLQAISESCVEALAHKNPTIRARVGQFLARAFGKTKASVMNKALIKTFVQPLCKNIDHGAAEVRDGAYQALGTLFKLVGENKMMAFLSDLDKLKMDKINECAGKVDVGTSKSSSSPPAASSAPPSKPVSSKEKTKPSTSSSADSKKSGEVKKVVKGGKKSKPAPAKSQPSDGPPPEAELSEVVVDEMIAKVISDEERAQILNNNWKERLAGLQVAAQKIKMLPPSEMPCQSFVKLLTMKPGWKDNNFNCLNEKFKLLSFLARNGSFSRTSGGLCIIPTVDKVGDIKCGSSAKDALSDVSEATGFPWVAEQVLGHSMGQKNPKIQSESLNWLSTAIQAFGISGLNLKQIIANVKTAIAATNPTIRSAALGMIGTLALYVGEKLRMFFESEKPALLQQIEAEIEKVKGQSPPAPTRGLRKSSGGADDEEEDDAGDQGGVNIDDMVPRVNINGKITDALIGQMADKNWKERKQALETTTEILNEAKFVAPDLGDLPSALKARLADSNKILLTTTLNILSQLATSLGPHCGKYVGVIAPSIINVLADSKPQLRQAALKCMNTWLENSKLSMWLEGDTISVALSVTKNTFLRIELLNWLCEKLAAASKLTANAREGLELCVPVVYSCCEDRSGEVRAKAQGSIPAIMRHLSYDKMVKGAGKLSATSKSSIIMLLDKARDEMPPPPAKSSKSSAPKNAPAVKLDMKKIEEELDVDDQKPAPPASNKAAQSTKDKKATSAKRATSAQRKPKQEEDTSPMFMKLANGKEQRMKDEAKLKTIKWNFKSPREELVVQLQQQLSTCVGSSLLTELFHADFQRHLKAITMLNQALSSDWDSTVQCLDVLLRWFTLKFYDKNTTVHIKSLEYIKSLFDKLIENDYRMTDYEVHAFVPHLITKIGENKDNIRKAVHGTLKQISLVYPASKLFNHVMDGIKSKNSRQRSECLDEIALLIATHGVGVCQPTAAKALKEVATNISDRDKGVRSSALNAIVAAYNVSGDIVYKQVGRLNEKDMSMLEERIKRSGKYNEAPPAAAEPVAATSVQTVKETRSLPSNLSRQQAPVVDKSNSLSSMRELRSSGSHGHDEVVIPEEIRRGIAELPVVNVDHLLEPLEIPDYLRKYEQGDSVSSHAGQALDLIIAQLSSLQLDSTITAIHELYEVVKHKEKISLLEDKIDQLLSACTTQIRMTSERYLPMIVSSEPAVQSDPNMTKESFMSLCKSHFGFLAAVFDLPKLASKASTYVLFDMLRAVIQIMINEQFVQLFQTTKITQILNLLVLRMIENCDPTAIMCATVKVQQDSMEGASSAYADLVVKCLWKLGRQVPQLLAPVEQGGFTQKPLQVAAVLSEIDRYWSAYPRGHAVYERFKTDMPIRSMKTIVLILCKNLGSKIMEELDMISHPEESGIVAIIRKQTGSTRIPLKKSDKKENIGVLTGVSLDAKLSSIFKKIGDRQLTKEGLLELYEFKCENPHYDVEPRINSLEVEFFRDYVKRGLKKIEEEKRSKGLISAPKTPIPSARASNADVSDKEYWERLNRLRATCGLEPLTKEGVRSKLGMEPATNGNADNKVLAPNTNTLNQPGTLAYRSMDLTQNSRSSGSPVPSSGGPTRTGSTSTSLSDLKRRLEQIKQSSSRP
ncbi:unnamed protein product [Clavelina lepadiformis]|uniref:TOG domain-containing protein n=1 Tax=Clavelina lepadiformis TaxID=159417 RepID=A0ABP0GN57_CLALP